MYAIDVSKWQGTMDWRTVKKVGMYMKGECYLAKDGTVKRCLQDNCVWDAAGLPSAWEEVQI